MALAAAHALPVDSRGARLARWLDDQAALQDRRTSYHDRDLACHPFAARDDDDEPEERDERRQRRSPAQRPTEAVTGEPVKGSDAAAPARPPRPLDSGEGELSLEALVHEIETWQAADAARQCPAPPPDAVSQAGASSAAPAPGIRWGSRSISGDVPPVPAIPAHFRTSTLSSIARPDGTGAATRLAPGSTLRNRRPKSAHERCVSFPSTPAAMAPPPTLAPAQFASLRHASASTTSLASASGKTPMLLRSPTPLPAGRRAFPRLADIVTAPAPGAVPSRLAGPGAAQVSPTAQVSPAARVLSPAKSSPALSGRATRPPAAAPSPTTPSSRLSSASSASSYSSGGTSSPDTSVAGSPSPAHKPGALAQLARFPRPPSHTPSPPKPASTLGPLLPAGAPARGRTQSERRPRSAAPPSAFTASPASGPNPYADTKSAPRARSTSRVRRLLAALVRGPPRPEDQSFCAGAEEPDEDFELLSAPSDAEPPPSVSAGTKGRLRRGRRVVLLVGPVPPGLAAFALVRAFCERWGEVSSMESVRGGSMRVEFRDSAVYAAVCRDGGGAAVLIDGVGSVRLRVKARRGEE